MVLPLIEWVAPFQCESAAPVVSLPGAAASPSLDAQRLHPWSRCPWQGDYRDTGLPDARACLVTRGPGWFLKTVGRRDAAIEHTGTYLQRVLRNHPGHRV